MRDIEKLLVVLNILGSLILGFHQDLALLAIPVAGFAVYVVIEDRALRSRIGARAWPSEGFADFDDAIKSAPTDLRQALARLDHDWRQHSSALFAHAA